MRIDEFYGVTK